MDLSDLIDRNAAFAPDAVALRFGGDTISYSAFAARIGVAARALKSTLGIARGDRVAILSANHPDFLVLLYACARLGAMLVPINWRLAIPEQIFILTDASVKALVVEQNFSAIAGPLAKVLPDARVVGLDHAPAGGMSFEQLLTGGSGDGRHPDVDVSAPLLVVYTSGTTGRPKGAVLSQNALLWNGLMSQHMTGMSARDHILSPLPFFHVGGLNIHTTPALQAGASVTIHPRFDPDAVLTAFANDKPTLIVLVPAAIQALLDHPRWAATDISSLRAWCMGGTLVPQHIIDTITARGVPALQIYGLTETTPICIYSRLGGEREPDGSTGLEGLFCEARVVDDSGRDVPPGSDGEIVVRGPVVFDEYWRNRAATDDVLRDGWFHTGDIGRRDAAGYFFVHDRKKNMIISGGENIYPAEIERVLGQHPAIAGSAVVGRPDPKWQEVPVAYVVKKPGQKVDAEEIKTFLGPHLARFKIPRDVVFVDELPRNVLGKVQHFRVKQEHESGAKG